jgi:hypothetical protein
MPLSFIDNIDAKRHLMLVHDDPKKAREIEFHFLRRGLEKGERGIYLTHDDPKLIERDMERYGINLRHYKKSGMLRILQIANPMEHPGGVLKGADSVMRQITMDSKIPFRVVGRLISNVGFEEGMSVEYCLEKTFYSIFDDSNGSVMCTYDFSQIQSNNEWRTWLHKLEMCHHASILNICENAQIKINTQ